VRVLLDSCVWRGAAQTIAEAGHDVDWVGHWDRDPGDAEILRVAYAQHRILVTLDKDFGELAIVRGAPHRGLIRVAGLRGPDQGPAIVEVLRVYQADLSTAAILTVSADRVRVRPGVGP
jgi:predicted nuclease of predicted toxin-antitoxin system